MSKAFNLASYDDVKAHAAAILNRIAALAAPSCRRHRRQAKVPGLNLASICSENG